MVNGLSISFLNSRISFFIVPLFGKHLIQNCRRILRHTTLGTKKFRLSNKQECNKEGVGHWDRDFPYPYGNDELYVKCKMCSIDLEIYKLANKLW
jgi:hypothetical protein